MKISKFSSFKKRIVSPDKSGVPNVDKKKIPKKNKKCNKLIRSFRVVTNREIVTTLDSTLQK